MHQDFLEDRLKGRYQIRSGKEAVETDLPDKMEVTNG